MIEWLSNNWGNILVIAIVVICVALAVRSMVRSKKAGKTSCGCGCSNCAMSSACHSNTKK